ncbi:MAG: hypothetical protein U0996_01530 [Planctomycetaceae bacterium]
MVWQSLVGSRVRLVVMIVVNVLAGCSNLLADLVPENVAVVVNGESEVSRRVAENYVRLRDIPPQNVISISKLSNTEKITVDEFRDVVLKPVLKAIEERGLQKQINVIAYSAEIPTAIEVQKDAADKKLPQVLTPVASINGLTFLYQAVLEKDIRYLDLNINQYARRVSNSSQDTPWSADELQKYGAAVQSMQDAVRAARSSDPKRDVIDISADALATMESLATAHPNSSELHYNFACLLAMSGDPDRSVAALQSAVKSGWWDHRHTARDEDLKTLRDRADFKALIEQMKTVVVDMQPAVSFDASKGWAGDGTATSTETAPRYLLSVVLACTTGRGLSFEDSIKALEASAQSDGTRPNGTIYFERNGDVRSNTREWGFANAARKLQSLGVNAIVEDGVLPKDRNDVAGAVIGISDFDWSKSNSRILPGAIVEHLTSFGGVMTKGAGQTPLTEFLKHGAAGSSGTVTEPYAIQAKFPTPFLHVFYAEGSTLAEAFYQSVTGPYQLLIVGDPLANPWRKPFEIEVPEKFGRDASTGRIQIKAGPKPGQTLQPASWQLYVDGKLVHSVTGEKLLFELDPAQTKAQQKSLRTNTADSPTLVIVARAANSVETVARVRRSLK